MQTGFASHPSDDSRPVGTMDTRQRVHGMWAAVATAWGEHADYVDQRVAPVTSRLIEFVSPAAGDHVLELACGAGGLGLEAAARVGAQGSVVLSDVAKQMTDIALERARERGLRNVSGRPLDLEAIDEPDASYDIVLCREGLMFALDPARALREMYRVLKPGGRVALSVWGPRSRNPWLGLVFDAASNVLGRPVPPTGLPGPFSLGAEGQLAAAFAGSALSNVTFEEIAVETRAPSFEDFWDRTTALAGPLTKILAELPAGARDQLKAGLRQSLAPYVGEVGLSIPGVAIVASGRRS